MIEQLSREELMDCLHKRCSSCNAVKFIAEFAKRTARGKAGYQPKCRACVSEYNKRHWKGYNRCKTAKAVYDAKREPVNRGAWKRFVGNCRVRSREVVGTEGEFNAHYSKKQCDSCGTVFAGSGSSRKCIDHCHETGRIRGALCHGCNSAEGLAGGIDGLRNLISYLERHEEEK